MARRRSRSRSRSRPKTGGGGRSKLRIAVVLLIAIALVVAAGPVYSFTNLLSPRDTNTDVVSDPSGLIGVNTTGPGDGATERLTELTNNFDQTVDLTIELTGSSTDWGSLYVNGVDYGDSATFDDVSPGATKSVDVALTCSDAIVGEDVTYTVDVTDSGITGKLDTRRATIEKRCLTWYTASDWDNVSREHGVVHEDFGDRSAEDVELGYNSTENGLVSYWPLDEDSGSTATDVAGNNDGSITGATLGRTGILGTTAYDFDGSDDVVNVSSSSELQGGSGATISASAWFKADSASGGNNGIVGKQQDTSDGDWGLVYRDDCPDWGTCSGYPSLNSFTDNGVFEGGGSTYTYDHSHTSGSDQITLVVVAWEGDNEQEVSSVTYGGNSLTEGVDVAFESGGFWANAEIWYVLDADMPASGTNTVEVNHPNTTESGDRWRSFAYTFDDVNQTSPVDTATDSNSNSASLSADLSSDTNEDVLVSAIADGDGVFYSWDNSETEEADVNSSTFGAATAWKRTSNGPGTVTTGATANTEPNRHALATLTLETATHPPYVGYYSEDGGNDYGLFYDEGIENGNRYHAGFVLDQANDNLYLYVDGERVMEDESLPQVSANTTADVEIGGTTYSSDYFDGEIDEVRVYDRTLSDSGMASLANGSVPHNASAEWNGTHVTGWQTADSTLDVSTLELSDVVADVSDGTATVYVESDTNADGAVDETSAGIGLNDSIGPYDVTGLTTDSDRFRLRVEMSTTNITETPCFSGTTLSQVGGLSNGSRDGCGMTDATANKDPTADFTYTDTSANWYNDSWKNRKEITIDHTQVASDLSDFPVLVNVSDSDLAADAQNDGDDILFTTGNGTTKLDHEIEEFDGSTGDLAAWVEVPQVNSTSPDTSIYVYYNNSGAANQENAAGVWDSNYVAVWHFDEEGAGTVRSDSTSFDNDATPQNFDGDENDAGRISDAAHLDGSDDHLNASDSTSLEMSDGDNVTVEAWVNKDTAQSGWIAMVQKSDQSYNLQFDGGDNPEFTIYDDGWRTADSGMTVNTGQWYHLVGTFDDSTGTIRIYVNGTEMGTGSASYISDASGWDVGIGENLDATGRHLDGLMDEVRISDTARSAAWIETAYNTTNDPSSFHSIGAEETEGAISLDASDSSDPDGTVETYKWDFDDDGVYEETTTSATTTHEFAPGDHPVTLQVIDDDSATDNVTKTVTFLTDGPTAKFTYDETWSKRKAITIDHTKVATDLSDYPVLINLSDSDLADKAQDDGDDILFTNASGVQLDHEIESFDGSTGELVAWVKVPSVSASSDTTLYMYYNNSGASNQENVSGVWSNGYVGVWHLSETSGSTAFDSTGYDNDGSIPAGVTLDTAGKAGRTFEWDGSDNEVAAPDSSSLDVSGTNLTLSLWVNSDSDGQSSDTYFGAKGGYTDASVYGLKIDGGSTDVTYAIGTGGSETEINSGWSINLDTWHYIAETYDGSTMRFYGDGMLRDTNSLSGNIDTSNQAFGIGAQPNDPNNRRLDGQVDEIRIANVTRSDGWLATEYNNTNDPSSFYSVDSETSTVAASFDASNSSDSDGTVSTYEWDWDGDGGYETSGSTPLAVHDFGSTGDYDVTLRVTDDQGATNTTTKTVSIGNQAPSPAFSYTSWTGRKALTIDHTQVASDLSGFPVLVDVTDRDLEYEAQSDGDDILFTESDGETKLAHEIEKFNDSNGHLVAWVRVPNVSSTANTTIYMYYNNSRASNQENVSGVWDSNYKMVQHLDGTSGDANDSTSYGNDGTVVDVAARGQDGMIGDAHDFEADNNHGIEVLDDASLDITSEVTLSAWIKPETVNNWKRIVAKSHTTNDFPYTLYGLLYDDADHLRMEIAECTDTGNSTCQNGLDGATTVPTTSWTHATVTYDGSAMRIYFNGTQDASTSLSETIPTNDVNLTIGKSGFDADYYDGLMDEVRVSDTARSAAWIETTYNNTADPSNFVTVGSEENGTLARFDASNSSDPDGTVSTYEWDFTDDGTYEESSSSATTRHRYSSAGDYDVTLRVTDDEGATDTVTKSITLNGEGSNAAPTADFTTSQVDDDWYDAAWEDRKEITIDHTEVASDLSDFPVLVNLTDSDLAADAQNDGDDILFTTGNGTTKLDHEIEEFDGSTGGLVAWVEVPEINSTSPDTSIYVYYNNSGAANQENVAGVWSNGHVMVQHLNESSGDAIDSTSNSNDGTINGATQGVTGQVDGAYDFDGSNDEVNVSHGSSLDITGDLTVSAWVRHDSNDYMGAVGKAIADGGSNENGYGLVHYSDDTFGFFVAENDNWKITNSDSTYTDTGTWHHLVGVRRNGTNYLYVDGVEQTDTGSQSLGDSGDDLTIGRQYADYDGRWWNGSVDEVRVSDTSRSAVWIETEYNNTNDPSSFYTVGGEESGVSVDFDASSSSDPDGVIDIYEWDWDDDGTYETSTSSATTSHTFEPGTHNVTLRVTDDEGATDTTTKSITV